MKHNRVDEQTAAGQEYQRHIDGSPYRAEVLDMLMQGASVSEVQAMTAFDRPRIEAVRNSALSEYRDHVAGKDTPRKVAPQVLLSLVPPEKYVGGKVQRWFYHDTGAELLWIAVDFVDGGVLHGTVDTDAVSKALPACGEKATCHLDQIVDQIGLEAATGDPVPSE